MELGNGGFDPGYLIIGVGVGGGGYADEGRTLVDYQGIVRESAAEELDHPDIPLLQICDWGCAAWFCIDCDSADFNIVTLSGSGFTRTAHSPSS